MTEVAVNELKCHTVSRRVPPPHTFTQQTKKANKNSITKEKKKNQKKFDTDQPVVGFVNSNARNPISFRQLGLEVCSMSCPC
jgi:hypothetical protein